MIPVILLYIWSVIPDAQTKMSVSEIASNSKPIQQAARQQTILFKLFTHVAHYIRLVLAATGVTMAGLC